tara:strand:- start:271 stop:624 length:354 start_codon:yes stop_codon:yes gene_type:complete
MNTNMRLIALLFILIAPSWAAAQYTDERFSIKSVPTYVNIIDDAKDGCWTNIGEVRTYIEDKLAENGAVIVEGKKDADVLGLRVIGSLYRKQAIDVEPQNFNIVALTWLGKKLQELD